MPSDLMIDMFLPDQTGNAGKKLITDGITCLWDSADAWPFDYYTTDLISVVRALGSLVSTLVITSPQVLTTSLSIPSNISIEIKQGGVITVPPGDELIIYGSFDAGMYQCFAGESTVTLSSVSEVYPEWFGAVGDGITDDTAAITAAHATGKLVHYSNGTYLFTGDNLDLSGGITRESEAGVIFTNGRYNGIIQWDRSGNLIGLMHNHLEEKREIGQGASIITSGSIVAPPLSVASVDSPVDLVANWYQDFGMAATVADHNNWYTWQWNHTDTTANLCYKAIESISIASDVVTITTTTNHGYIANDTIVVVNAAVPEIVGTRTVLSAPTLTTLTFAYTLADVTNTVETGYIRTSGVNIDLGYQSKRHPLLGWYRGDDINVLDWQCYWLREAGITAIIPQSRAAATTLTKFQLGYGSATYGNHTWETPAGIDHWLYLLINQVPNARGLRIIPWVDHGAYNSVYGNATWLTELGPAWDNNLDVIHNAGKAYTTISGGKKYITVYLHDGESLRGGLDNYSGYANTKTFLAARATHAQTLGYDGIAVMARLASPQGSMNRGTLIKSGVLYFGASYGNSTHSLTTTYPTADPYPMTYSGFVDYWDNDTPLVSVPAIRPEMNSSGHPTNAVQPGSTPELWRKLLRKALHYVQSTPNCPNMLTIYNVSEWAEGGISLQPTLGSGYDYLDAIREVAAEEGAIVPIEQTPRYGFVSGAMPIMPLPVTSPIITVYASGDATLSGTPFLSPGRYEGQTITIINEDPLNAGAQTITLQDDSFAGSNMFFANGANKTLYPWESVTLAWVEFKGWVEVSSCIDMNRYLTQSGTAAANTITPRYIGDEYLKTDTSVTYVAKGLSTSDWVESINAASIQTLTNKTLTAPTVDTINSTKFKITAEGGYAIKLTNRTGAASVKGYLLEASDVYDDAVRLLPIDTPAPIGVVYESGIADGAEMWVVISGIADVYYVGNVTRGTFSRMTWTADSGSGAGKAIAEAIPSSPFASDKHFAEIGHAIQSRTGAGLARTVLHFN